MEASQSTEGQKVPAEGESADGTPVAVGDSGALDDHQPLGAEDAHGSVTPRAAPPAGAQQGMDPTTGQPGVPPGPGGVAT